MTDRWRWIARAALVLVPLAVFPLYRMVTPPPPEQVSWDRLVADLEDGQVAGVAVLEGEDEVEYFVRGAGGWSARKASGRLDDAMLRTIERRSIRLEHVAPSSDGGLGALLCPAMLVLLFALTFVRRVPSG